MCKHQFFEIKKMSLYAQGSPSLRTDMDGVLVICAECQEVRELWENGTMKVRIMQNKVNPYDPNSTAGPAKN
jgi:hypothetical protein